MPEEYAASTAFDRTLENWPQGRDWLAPYHKDFEENYAFLYKFEHYDDANANERDRRRTRPKGRQSASKHRHKLAQVLKQSLHISTRGVDQDTDPHFAEDVRWILEYDVQDPQKRFKRHLRRAVSLMLSTGMGALGLDVRDDLCEYPEVRPVLKDPRKLTWTPGWQDPDDDTCPWVTDEIPMMIPDIERRGKVEGRFKWSDTENLSPEIGAEGVHGRAVPADRPIRGAAGGPYPAEPTSADRIQTIWCWYRFDHDYAAPEEKRDLEPHEYYHACPNCPNREYSFITPEGDTVTGGDLPEHGDFCPACEKLGAKSPMSRVEREKVPYEVAKYAAGRRLVIIAPNQGRTFYDGPWPYASNGRPIRNVPIVVMKSYDLPLEPWASCDTVWDFSYQVIANATDRRLYEWISRAGGVLIAGADGLYNANNSAPFEFTDRPISLARWRGMGQPGVTYFQPHGMVGELLPFMNFWNGQFRTDMGISDLGLTPERSKDIPVGTVKQLERTGEIPVDDHAEQVREAMQTLFGVWYDIKKAIMTQRQIVRLRGPQGSDILLRMRGEQLPNVDVIVGAPPSWNEYDAEKAKQIQQLLLPPPGMDPMTWLRVMPIVAETAGIPLETVRKFQRALAPPPPPAPGPPNGPPNGNIPPAIAARMQSMGGMVPPQMQGA
jgi:hypothetical protein